MALRIKQKAHYPLECDFSGSSAQDKSFVPAPELAKLLRINICCIMRRSPLTGSQQIGGEWMAKISGDTVWLDDESGFL